MNRNSGDVVWRSLLFNSFVVSGILSFSCDRAFSQITPDDTLGNESSVVNPRDANSESIDGGAVRGQNLFHSFEEFNVGEDRGVYFANPDAVTDIFSRVTGNDVSDILGTLGVDGAANLFLINPNGIVFGEGASLDVQGSFTATTADGIEFGEQGFFSASDPESPSLLTINPSAYLFNQVAPGAIANNSQAAADFNPATSFDDDFFGLRVPDGQSLLLLGGDLNFDGGGLVASGGRIDLGAVTGENIVGLNANGSLNIPDSIARGDVSLTNGAGFLVAGDGGGDLAIAAKDIRIDSASTIDAGIFTDLGSPDAQAGDLNLNATGTISVKDDDSSVYNSIFAGATGKAGNLTIDTNNLIISGGGQIGTATFGKGDAGSLVVRASNIELQGTSSDGEFSSGLFTTIEPQAQGNSGNLTINTDSLSATNGGQINSFTRGRGDAGDITIQATDTVTFDGVDSNDNYSSSSSSVLAGGEGDGGNINITAGSLSLTNGGQLEASVREAFETLPGGRGQGGNINIDVDDTLTIADGNRPGIFASLGTGAVGNGGNIDIQAGNLIIRDSGQLEASTFGQGNAGDIIIRATDSVTFDGFNGNNYSSAFSNVGAGGIGDGGDINITARSLSLTNGGQLDASVRAAFDSLSGGEGQGGNVNINVDDTLTISGENVPGIFANLGAGAVGNAGKINIQTGNLLVKDGGQINSFTRGKGNAGDITIQATDEVAFDGVDSDLASSVEAGAKGDGGNIKITASSLSLTNGGYLDASIIKASDSLPSGQGQGGNIDIQAGNLIIRDGGYITSSTSGQGDSGNIFITADNSISLDASSNIVNNVEDISAVGDAGKIEITTGSLSVTKGSQINSFTRGRGNAGDISIQATDTVTFNGFNGNNYSSAASSVLAGGEGNGGNINITAGSLSLTNGGYLKASVDEAFDFLPGGEGQGGNVNINVNDTLTISGENVPGIFANLGAGAVGRAGNIDIQTRNLVAKNGGQINSFTRGRGNAGDISIQATDTVTFDGFNGNNYSSAASSVQAGGEGNGGNINITARSLSLTNGGQLEASVREAFETLPGGQGQGGNINIDVDDTLTIADGNSPGIFASLEAGAVGNAGKIDIQARNLLVKDGGQINSFTRGRGDAGDITIQATDTVTFNGFNGNNYSSAASSVLAGGEGDGGNINITAGSLSLTDGSYLEASVREAFETLLGGQGQGGNININVDDTLTISGENALGIFARLDSGAVGNGGNIDIQTGNLIIRDGGQITSSTFGEGDSGNISITADNTISLDATSIIANNVESSDAVGNAGKIDITTGSLSVTKGSQINSFTRGQGDAGDINIQATDEVTFSGVDRNELPSSLNTIVEDGAVGDGGNISLTAGDIRLRDDSDISTNVSNGTGDGGNISITADSIIAFDDSDIFAFAAEGQGGNITLDTPAYFGENFTLNSLTSDPKTLDINSRADVNATGAVSGSVAIPDVSFIQNSLTELENNSINTDELVANSCVAPVGDRQQGKFIITGGESLPVRPGDGIPSKYPTGEVRNVPESNHSSWQPGDPIVEPQGAYRLANGKLVLSRQCSQ